MELIKKFYDDFCELYKMIKLLNEYSDSIDTDYHNYKPMIHKLNTQVDNIQKTVFDLSDDITALKNKTYHEQKKEIINKNPEKIITKNIKKITKEIKKSCKTIKVYRGFEEAFTLRKISHLESLEDALNASLYYAKQLISSEDN